MLATLRKEKGLTQKEIAEKLDITQKAWQSYESGFRTPRPATMQKIEDFFGVPKEKIFFAAFDYKTSPNEFKERSSSKKG
ncbi:helix-turn-helix domain-containing protein [Ligilactobacillus faecis]|uniref:helix-turn-helix domain-containing protein n=1 Tax=Ligilactobacillus faecis TaxID=762833 RepID=UPI002468DFF1|nr:helix-turn-helix transcriptional regulator [Ligilactobacillus faecis]WGN89817.1 helix-turn-helix transcriptional regulator [Ligilactobacillus faecis]